MVVVRGWGVAGHYGAFTGIHNIPDQISEQGEDSYDYTIRRKGELFTHSFR